MSGYGPLFGGKVSAQKDRNHFLTDWESNIDGHLMVATEKFLAGGKQDFDGFKEYMRAVFKRPFVGAIQARSWFDNLKGKIEGDGDIREQVLRDLYRELRL